MTINRGYIFIAFIATVIIATAGVGRASPATIALDPSEVKDIDPGGTFNVDITVSDVSNLFAWQLVLYFDPDVLQVDNVTEGPFLAAAGNTTDLDPTIDNTAGYIIAGTVFELPLPEFGASGDGVLATIVFSVTGRGTVTLEFEDDETLTFLKETEWVDYQAKEGRTRTISSSLTDGTFTNGGAGLSLGLSLPLIIAIVVVVVLCGVGAFYFIRRRG